MIDVARAIVLITVVVVGVLAGVFVLLAAATGGPPAPR
jgi:hypothetical protein